MLLAVAHGALMERDSTFALTQLLAIEKEHPSHPSLHHLKALAFHAKHDFPSAIASARRAVELDPKFSDARNTLGKLLMDAGRSGEALPHLRQAAADPVYRDTYKPRTNLGILHYRRGEWADASRELGQAIQTAPAQACIAYYYRGHLELRESRFSEAVRDYERASSRTCAGFPDAHLALGIAYEHSHQYEKARRKFLEIQKRYPETGAADQAMQRLRNIP
jgi:type IV pilus assembly protein PilF